VQPGKHDIVPPELLMQRFWTPAVFEPQVVSLVHASPHQAPLQVDELGHCVAVVSPPHGVFEEFEQGSPTLGFVAAQMCAEAAVSGWQVVPENAVQSRFVVHPGKQVYTLLPLNTHVLLTPSELAPQLVSEAEVQLVAHQPV
jgi:hypothetical protein